MSLPSASDSERALVSSLCHCPALFGALPAIFSPAYIEDIPARSVYETARKLWLENKAVSFDTVRLSLSLCAAAIDVVTLDAIWDFVPSGANLNFYLEIVLTKARAQACTRSANKFIANIQAESTLSTESLDVLISGHANELGQSWGTGQNLPTIQEQVVDFNEWISTASDVTRAGVSFGLEKLDDILGSVQPGDLIVIGGPTGYGKSALALQAAHHSLSQMGVCYFSLEMPSRQLVGRLVANISGVPLSRMLKAKITASELSRIGEASEEVARMPLRIIDGQSCSPENIRSTLKRLKILEEPAGLCVVDYLQLLKAPARSGSEERRETVVAEFARSLKETATSEGCVMMVLSQLNDDGRLRESRAIGQHADVVLLISQAGEDSILRIEKHRNGPCGAAVAHFCGERFCFVPKAGKTEPARVRH